MLIEKDAVLEETLDFLQSVEDVISRKKVIHAFCEECEGLPCSLYPCSAIKIILGIPSEFHLKKMEQ